MVNSTIMYSATCVKYYRSNTVTGTLVSSRLGYMFVRQSTKKLRDQGCSLLCATGYHKECLSIPLFFYQSKNKFLRRLATSINSIIVTISTDSAHETSHLTTKMMITDQEATELKSWVVKKLEDMYAAHPSMPAP